jgi:hypothetical protein
MLQIANRASDKMNAIENIAYRQRSTQFRTRTTENQPRRSEHKNTTLTLAFGEHLLFAM